MKYQVPGNPETDVYVLPVSGGADSSALAILLHELAPTVPFQMVFTDTGAESNETLLALENLEQYLGKKIERLQEKGLFELINQYNGFLPSTRDRYCTKDLKLKPFRKWLEQFAGRQKWMFVGIRKDEEFRLAFTIDECETLMPFVDLGITRGWVYRKLSDTIGIPNCYKTRSRSGCTVCPFQRTSEIIGLLQSNPVEFQRGADCEKLSVNLLERHAAAVPLWNDTRIAQNHHSFPEPTSSEPLLGRIKEAKMPDLFGVRIFLGGEFFYDGFPGAEPFVWQQRLVCFSPTLAGLKKQLDGRYQHLLSTAEVYGLEPEDIRRDVQFAIWYIELPSDVFDPEKLNTPGSYTWHQGISYQQIRHIVSWGSRVLNAEYLKQLASSRPQTLSVEYEWKESATEALTQSNHEIGQVILSQWYQPTEHKEELEDEEELLKLMPCPMCHI